MKKLLLVVVAVLLVGSTAYADEIDDYIELLRDDAKAVKKLVVMEAMDLSDEEGEKFWPIYEKYQREVDKLNRARLKLIEDYADNYWDMTDSKAKQLVNDTIGRRLKRMYLRKDYFRKFSYAIGATQAAKFMQLDNVIAQIVSLQISAELPLIEKWN